MDTGGDSLDASYIGHLSDQRKAWTDAEATPPIDVRGVAGPKPAGDIAAEGGHPENLIDMAKGAARSAIELFGFPARAAGELAAASAGRAFSMEGASGEATTPEGGTDPERMADVQKIVDDVFEEGKQFVAGAPTEGSEATEQVLGVPFAILSYPAQKVGEYVLEHTGDPFLGKAAELAMLTGTFKAAHAAGKLTREDYVRIRESLPAKLREERGSIEISRGGESGGKPPEQGRFPGPQGITFEHLLTEDGAKVQTQDLIKDAWKKIDEERRGTVPLDETVKEAQEVITSGEFTAEDILSRATGTNWETPSKGVAARMIWTASQEKFLEAIKERDAGTITDQGLKNYTAYHLLLTEKVYGGTAEAGRTLQAYNADVEGAAPRPYMDQVYDILRNADRAGISGLKFARRIEALGTPEQAAKFARDAARPGAWKMFTELWINALLSNPATHVTNALSNTIVLFNGVQERGAAGTARALNNSVRRALGGQEVSGVEIGEPTVMLHAMIETFTDSLRLAARTLESNASAFGGGKVDVDGRPSGAITTENLRALGNRIAGAIKAGSPLDPDTIGPMGKAFDLIAEWGIRGPGKALLASDEFFKWTNYRMEIAAQAWREAKAMGGEGETLADRYQNLKDNPTPGMVAMAEEYAKKQTFTDEGGRFTAAAMAFRGSHPTAILVLPFIRTPSRIASYTFQRMPVLNVLSSQLRNDLFKGNPVQRDLAISKLTTSAMAAAAVASLVSAGAISGGGPRDRKMRALLEAQGWQPYSIRIDEKWINYDRMDPIGGIFGAVADYVELKGSMNPDEETDIESIPVAIVLGFTRAFTSKTYLRGLSNAIDALMDPARSGMKMLRSFAGSFVPAAVASANRNWFDPFRREVDSITDAWKARVPGYSENLPPMRDPWGNPSINHGWALGVLLPFRGSDVKQDPAAAELLKLGISVPKLSKTMAGRAPTENPVTALFAKDQAKFGFKWTAGEFDELARLYGNLLKLDPARGFKIVGVGGDEGMGMHDYLNALVTGKENLPIHVPLPDGEKAEKYTDLPEAKPGIPGSDMRADILRGIMSTYRAAATGYYLKYSHERAKARGVESMQERIIKKEGDKAVQHGANPETAEKAVDQSLERLPAGSASNFFEAGR
jgi:hypothetical protein